MSVSNSLYLGHFARFGHEYEYDFLYGHEYEYTFSKKYRHCRRCYRGSIFVILNFILFFDFFCKNKLKSKSQSFQHISYQLLKTLLKDVNRYHSYGVANPTLKMRSCYRE